MRTVLARYGSITSRAMRAYLPHREPDRALYELVREYPSRGGKALRASVCLATCAAFGGRIEDALPTAVSVELAHTAFLIHDDIEGESETRRGSPTLHRKHGVPLALNAGDATTLLAVGPLLENADVLGLSMTHELLREFELMMQQTVEGQALELGWRRDNELALVSDDYLELVLKKTCWYTFIYPLRAGALIGSGERTRTDALTRLGFTLGVVFQIADDLENLSSYTADYGKEEMGDILEGKRTLMLIHLLTHADDLDRARVQRLLSRPRLERDVREVGAVRELMLHYGSIEYAREFVRCVARAAAEDLDGAFDGLKPSAEQDFLRCLLPYLLGRAHRLTFDAHPLG